MKELINIFHTDIDVTRGMIESRNRHKGCVVWLTGLSGSGKSSIANSLHYKLFNSGIQSILLDGDNLRHDLNSSPDGLKKEYGCEFSRRFGLGFSKTDRKENIRRTGSIANILAKNGIIAIVSTISPYVEDRRIVRNMVGEEDFVEVFVNTPIEICKERDPKGLYKKAIAGEIANFTGISDSYEKPVNPDIELLTSSKSPDSLSEEIENILYGKGILTQPV